MTVLHLVYADIYACMSLAFLNNIYFVVLQMYLIGDATTREVIAVDACWDVEVWSGSSNWLLD